ncbi:MAG: hypothetical protein ACRDPW_11445 [Mycobacteriales bacterium]
MRIVEGANHTRIYIGTSQTVVGRHTEIEDRVARGIFSQVEGALGKGWWK